MSRPRYARHDESLAALHAAFESFPAEQGRTIPAALIDAAASQPSPQGVSIIRDAIGQLPPDARLMALNYLVRLRSQESIELFARLYPKESANTEWHGVLCHAMLEALPNGTLQHVLIGALSSENSAAMAAPVLLEAVQKNKVPESFLADHLAAIGTASDRWTDRLCPKRPTTAPTAVQRWNDKYRNLLGTCEYFPDLLGYAGPGAIPYLRNWLSAKDPRLSCFAIVSLLKLGQDVAPEDVDFVAADDEMRNLFYDQLVALRQRSKFPARFHTQDAFARSDMVRWLVYPTELDAVPDEIELMKVVDVDEGKEGIVSYYLFRFRTFAPHWAAKNGWLTGVAGGYRKADIPTTHGLGSTFSRFDKWDSKTPEKLLEAIIGTVGQMNTSTDREKPTPKP